MVLPNIIIHLNSARLPRRAASQVSGAKSIGGCWCVKRVFNGLQRKIHLLPEAEDRALVLHISRAKDKVSLSFARAI